MKKRLVTISTAALFAAFVFFHAPAEALAANYYIVAGGTGNRSGTDWSNAMADLPSTPVCGNTYFIAGGAYNYTGTGGSGSVGKIWSVNCSSGSQVYFYKAVDCSVTAAPYCGSIQPQNVSGWQASYGSTQAVFSHTADADPQLQYHNFINICGNYYTVDGVTPTSGTPLAGGQGIVFRSTNKIGAFISVSSAPGACDSVSQLDHINLKHIEFDGVDPQYGVNIISCSRADNVVTLSLASAPAWVVGNTIDVQNVTPSSFNTGGSGYGVTIATIGGDTLTFAQSGSDASCTAFGYAVLNYSHGPAIGIDHVSETFDQITVSDSYMHDIGGGAFGGSNIYTLKFTNNYVARNRSTYTQHQNGLTVANGGSFAGQMGPFTIANNIWEDIEGTMVAGMLGTGTLNGFNFYNNLVFCTQAASSAIGPSGAGGVNTAASPQCGVSQVSTDNNGNNVIFNAKYYGNTLANVTASPICGFHFGSASSTGDAKNNLFWNCSNGFAMGNSATPSNFTNGYNTVLASDTVTHSITCGGGTNCGATGNYTSGSASNPFVNDADTAKNFRLLSETIAPHLSDGNPLSTPYNVDILGITHGADGTWDRGAYEFVSQAILYGDVSENGSVTAYDASLAAQYAVGSITLTSTQVTKADVSGSGSVTSYDASLIAQYAVGLIMKFPVEGG